MTSTIEIIPAIDIIDGKCVRLTEGDYSTEKLYNEDAVDQAKRFEAIGLTRLHLVDLDGARSSSIVNIDVLERIVSQTDLTVDFGGGIKSEEAIQQVLDAGAKQVTVGSMAAKSPELVCDWIEKYGGDTLIIGADARDEHIAVQGWEEKTNWHIDNFLSFYVDKGILYSVCTDIAKDGMLQGPSFELYNRLNQKFPELKLIASGGVSSLNDIERLNDLGSYGVIIGKAFYEGNIDLLEMEKFLLNRAN